MLGKGTLEGARPFVDPVRELNEVIRLIHFLGRCKPTGLTATLEWAEERLEAIRDRMEEKSVGRGAESAAGIQ